MIPGSNLLKQASRLIKLQSMVYFAANGRTLNAARQWVPSFAAGTPMQASIQAVDRRTYVDLGLDLNSLHVNVYAPLNMVDLDRDTSGDRFIYNGDRYQMSKGQNWFAQDGWATCLAVRTASGVSTPI